MWWGCGAEPYSYRCTCQSSCRKSNGHPSRSATAQCANSHIASDPDEFVQAMRSVDIELDEAVFIDFGSGKGRALLLASAYPFRRIIGIEFAAELHAAATANFAARAAGGGEAVPVELIHGDATAYELPDDPLVLFLYNPFDAPVIAAVARRAMASWQANPRPMRIVYINPSCAREFLDAGWNPVSETFNHIVFKPD